jgi:hypothetical protein
MRRDQRCELTLVDFGEARHVAVGHEVRAVALVSRIGDRETDLVEARRPRQRATVLVRETPMRLRLIEEIERAALDA